MMYLAIQVKKRIWKDLVRDASGLIFHRCDTDGKYWVKAAFKAGRLKIEVYGLKAMS